MTATLSLVPGSPAHAVTYPTLPVIALNRTIPGVPFPGQSGKHQVSAHDNEGSAYVPSDNSLWIVDDNGRSAYELNASTGDLKRHIAGSELQAVQQLGGGGVQTDDNRYNDLESAAYDQATDTLYFFSGHCCVAAPALNEPSVFRLQRDAGGDFQLDSYQPLPESADATASAVRPDGVLWTGVNNAISTYDYATNTFGPAISIAGVGSRIYGMVFSDQDNLFIVGNQEKLIRVSLSTLSAVPGWSFDLAPYGIKDSRSVELVGNQFFIGDGFDFRKQPDVLTYATFVFDLTQLQPPVAGFVPSVTQVRGGVPMTFLDTSTGSIASHVWTFGDGTTSAEASPTHTYAAEGTFTVTETIANPAGMSTATHQVTVLPSTYRSGGYVLDGFGGLQTFRVGTGPTPPPTAGGAYWRGWDIARGLSLLHSGTGGYVLDGFGGLQPFRVGAGVAPAATAGGPYWRGWDIARGVAVLANGTGGYILDAFGALHPFSIGAGPLPPEVVDGPYWLGQDIAQGLAIRPDGSGGYIVDRFGGLHPFTIGAGSTPPAPSDVFYDTGKTVRGVALLSDGRGGFTVEGTGELHPFAINELPPGAADGPSWPAWDIARDVAVLPE